MATVLVIFGTIEFHEDKAVVLSTNAACVVAQITAEAQAAAIAEKHNTDYLIPSLYKKPIIWQEEAFRVFAALYCLVSMTNQSQTWMT